MKSVPCIGPRPACRLWAATAAFAAMMGMASCSDADEQRHLLAPEAPLASEQPTCYGPDQTACVQLAIEAAGTFGTVLFERGTTYTFDNPARLQLEKGTKLRATGSGSRPVLQFQQEHSGGSINLADSVELHSLDIRGVFGYTTHIAKPDIMNCDSIKCWCMNDEEADIETCPQAYGVNGASKIKWLIDDTHVIGFRDNGIHMTNSTGARISNSNISYNGRTGVAAYGLGSGGSTGYEVLNTVLTYNGEDGIDSSADDSKYEGNTARFNGWQVHAGDQNGILIVLGNNVQVVDNICSDNHHAGIFARGNGHTITGNKCHRNGSSGMWLDALTNTQVDSNYVGNNGVDGGLYFVSNFGNVSVTDNIGWENAGGCWPNPFPSGIVSSGNHCGGYSIDVSGPDSNVLFGQPQVFTWVAVPDSGVAPHQFTWSINYYDDGFYSYNWQDIDTGDTLNLHVDGCDGHFLLKVRTTDTHGWPGNSSEMFIENYVTASSSCW